MKNDNIDIYMFIDALGWEIIKDRKFLEKELPFRYPAKMQFGYSCTAIPTILSGKTPSEHKHLSFYYYAPDKSPFKIFKYLGLKYLPVFFDRWRVRHNISKIIKRAYGFTGYFELYAMPFDRLQYFDYIEKKDLFVPNGLDHVKNLADVLEEKNINYHISNWRLTENQNIDIMIEKIEKKEISFGFLYTAAMDSLLHIQTKSGKKVDEKLKWYESKIHKLIDSLKRNYNNYNLHIISDHGMTTKVGVIDLKKSIETTKYKFGKDYCAVYDSTMARFWFFNNAAEAAIMGILSKTSSGHILTEEEKIKFGIEFKNNMYGKEIFLLDPGWQIEPCDMGLKALPGMHGYTPEDKDSDASFLSTRKIENPPEWVGDFFNIMTENL
ncbi:MAG: alkaline phosphatase family protein [bacterium]|nr:alkaline phosphatase family protein [bacterium]